MCVGGCGLTQEIFRASFPEAAELVIDINDS